MQGHTAADTSNSHWELFWQHQQWTVSKWSKFKKLEKVYAQQDCKSVQRTWLTGHRQEKTVLCCTRPTVQKHSHSNTIGWRSPVDI